MKTIAVLIVEDDTAAAADLEKKLRRLRHDVIGIAESCRQALELSRQHRPDVILINVRLLNNPDAVKIADTIHKELSIPVVYLMENLDTTDLPHTKLSEACGYLIKPFAQREIEIAVRMASYRHEIDARLRASETRYRQFADSIPHLAWQCDSSGKVIDFNLRWYEYTGQAPDDVANERWTQAVHPDDRSAIRKCMADAILTVKPCEVEFRVRRATDGVYRWHLGRTIPVTEKGEVTCWYGSGSDIHDLRETQEALRKQKQRADEALATVEAYETHAPVGMAVIDSEFRYSRLNVEAAAIHGVPIEQQLGHPVSEVIPELWPQMKPVLERSLRGEQLKDMEITGTTRANPNDTRHWLASVFPFEAPGKTKGIGLIIMDITWRKRNEEALRKEQAFLREVIDTSPSLIFVKNRQGRFVLGNRALARAYGTTTQDIVGKTDTDLNQSKEQVVHFLANDLHVMDTRKALIIPEEPVLNADGTTRWVTTVKIPLFDEDGACNQILGVATDITDRREAEEEVRRFNVTLEKRVSERTAELTALNEELESFSYSISHDLRAPLRHVVGFVGLLDSSIRDKLDEQSRGYMAAIEQSTNRMGRLIDELLAFSRMGRTELRRQEVNLQSLVEQETAALTQEHADRAIKWIVGPLPAVRGDAAMLRQVFVNLLNNAVKFTRHAEHTVIEIGCQDKADEHVIFVQDNGVGFDMKFAGELFAVFYRLHTEAEFEGVGIGLAIVRRIVQRHGGRAWAEGRPGEGATIFFSLPKAET